MMGSSSEKVTELKGKLKLAEISLKAYKAREMKSEAVLRKTILKLMTGTRFARVEAVTGEYICILCDRHIRRIDRRGGIEDILGTGHEPDCPMFYLHDQGGTH